MNNKNLKNKILELRTQGFTYNEIQAKLNCSKGTISYHCGYGQKEKTKNRRIKSNNSVHPYKKKIEQFSREVLRSELNYKNRNKFTKIIQAKIRNFHKVPRTVNYMKPTFTVEDVIDKFGEKPTCYLTGQEIDITKTNTYAFDHKIPKSRGGSNELDNLGICTKQANSAKSDMTPDEFIEFCKMVVEYNKVL